MTDRITRIEEELAKPTTILPADIKSYEAWGKTLRYVDLPVLERIGNEIFGLGGWGYVVNQPPTPFYNGDRVEGWQATVSLQCVDFPDREQVGWCDATYNDDGKLVSIERSIKGAVTDACKKAWSTYGDRFGRFLWEGESSVAHSGYSDETPKSATPPPRPQQPNKPNDLDMDSWNWLRAQPHTPDRFDQKYRQMVERGASQAHLETLIAFAAYVGVNYTINGETGVGRFVREALPRAPNTDRSQAPAPEQRKQCPNCPCTINPLRNGKVPDTCWHCSRGIGHDEEDYCSCGRVKLKRFKQCKTCG